MNNTTHDDYFDKALKARLENLKDVTFEPTLESWEQIVSGIEKNEQAAVAFDNAFTNHIADLKFPSTDTDWHKMNHLLEQGEKEEAAFDTLFSQKLKSIPTEFKVEHWKLFEPKIDFFLRWHLRLKKYRVLEAAIFLLTIFPVLQFFDTNRKDNNGAPIVYQDDIEKQKQSVYSNLGSKRKEANTVASSHNKNNASLWNSVENAFSNLFSHPTTRSGDMYNSYQTNGTVTACLPNRDGSPLQFATVSAQLPYFSTKTKNYTGVNETGDDEPTDMNALNEIEKFNFLNRYVNVLNEIPVPNIKTPTILLKNVNSTPHNKWHAGLVVGYNQDFVSTNYILNNEIKSVDVLTPSLSVGGTVSVTHGKTELEAGLLYSQKTYQPTPIEHITGSFDVGYRTEKLQDITAHVVSMPINVKQAIYRTPKLRVYALGGVTAGVVVDVNEKRAVSVTYLQSNFPNSAFNPNVQPDRLELPTYGNNGLSHPMLSVNVGAGVEYKMGKKLSVYAQPVLKYQVSKNGIGSLNDKVSSLSLEVGVKTSL